MKKVLSILLVAMLIIGMFPATVSAAEQTVTITFNDLSKRSSVSNDLQVWTENEITVNYGKGSYNNGVNNNYCNPLRLYAGTTLEIQYPGMTKIQFTCNASKYVSPLVNSIDGAESSGNIVTVKLNGVDSFSIAKISAQTRINSLTVTYEESDSACKHTNQTPVAEVPAGCTTDGTTAGVKCADCNEILEGCEPIPAAHTWDEGNVTTEPGCETEGERTYTCTVCGETKEETVSATGHSYVDGTCSVCGAEEPNEVIFQLGEDGAAGTHVDGTEAKDGYTETVGGYELKITDNTKMYSGAKDLKGNSCIKLGTSSVVGGFSFTVPNDVVEVKIYAAKYKANATKLSINGTEYSLAGASDNGEYDEIVIDTTGTKTITLTTVSGGARAMINTIVFCFKDAEESDCQHTNTTTTTVDATCTEAGSTTVTCDDCGEVIESDEIPAIDHANKTPKADAVPGTCKVEGTAATYDCPDCGLVIGGESTGYGPHNYVDGVCDVCGEAESTNSVAYYIATKRSSGNYFYMTSNLGTASTKRYQAVDSGAAVLPGYIDVDDAAADKTFVLEENPDGTYKIRAKSVDGDSAYLGWTSGNSGTLVAAESAKNVTVTPSEEVTGAVNIKFDTRYLSLNGTTGNNYFAWYTGTQKQDLILIPVLDDAFEGSDENAYDTVEDALRNGVNTVTAVADVEVPLEVTVDGTRYVSLGGAEEKTHTYYALSLKLTNVSLRSSQAGIYYTAKINAPDLLTALEGRTDVSYGIMLSLTGNPTELVAKQHTTIEGIPSNGAAFFSGSVFNIFKSGNTPEDNNKRGEMPIYANAYIKIGDRLILADKGAAMSLQNVVEAIDAKLAAGSLTLEDSQQTALNSFWSDWSGAMSDWNITYICNG